MCKLGQNKINLVCGIGLPYSIKNSAVQSRLDIWT